MQKSTFTSVKNLRYFVPKPNQMTMNKKLLTVALSLTVIPSVLLAQKSATEHTIRANEAVKTELNFNDRQDYEDATGALSQVSMETLYWTKKAKFLILWKNGIF